MLLPERVAVKALARQIPRLPNCCELPGFGVFAQERDIQERGRDLDLFEKGRPAYLCVGAARPRRPGPDQSLDEQVADRRVGLRLDRFVQMLGTDGSNFDAVNFILDRPDWFRPFQAIDGLGRFNVAVGLFGQFFLELLEEVISL